MLLALQAGAALEVQCFAGSSWLSEREDVNGGQPYWAVALGKPHTPQRAEDDAHHLLDPQGSQQ